MKEENLIQKEILRKFMYNDKLRYNEVWDKKLCSSSKFDYHLKNLIIDGLLEKDNEYYILTNKGINIFTSLDGVEMQQKRRPIVCAFVICYREGEVLLNLRKKQPFLGYLNIPGGKHELGITIEEQAKQEFLEETGFIGKDLKLKCVTEKISSDIKTGEIAHHIIGYFYLCTKFSGELLKDTREGDNFWIKLEDIKNYKRFVDIDPVIDFAINGRAVKFYEIHRIVENGDIVDTKIIEK